MIDSSIKIYCIVVFEDIYRPSSPRYDNRSPSVILVLLLPSTDSSAISLTDKSSLPVVALASFPALGFLRIKFQPPKVARELFFSSPLGVAPPAGVEEELSRLRPRCSDDPACSSSVMSPVGVVASPVLEARDENRPVDLYFQESNLLELALRVILDMNVGFVAVAGVDSIDPMALMPVE